MSRTVLVVDDDDALRRLYGARLAAAGYRVVDAADARLAYRAARKEKPDAALVDVMMPVVDGWGLLAAFRDDAHLAGTRVVLMSAHRRWLEELAAGDAGADGYLAKGPRTGDVVDAVAAVLARRDGILASLARGGVWGPLSDVGLSPLLDAACLLGVRALLVVDDGNCTWSIWLDDGVIASAAASTMASPRENLVDIDALLSLMDVSDAPFSFELVREPAPARTLGQPWSALRPALCDALNARRARTRADVLSLDRRLRVNERRLRAWAGHAGGPALEIARELAAGHAPRELVAAGKKPVYVDAVVEDLVRRGVLQL